MPKNLKIKKRTQNQRDVKIVLKIQKSRKIQKKIKFKNFQKWLENPKIWKNTKKSHIFFYFFLFIFFLPKKERKKVFPIEEISLRQELSCSPRFRIQGGSPERYT